jgi:hypothetical protein
MNYILLNNVIFNQADIADCRELSDKLTEKFLGADESGYYDKTDYDGVINEICEFLKGKQALLIVSSFYYRLPCFVNMLEVEFVERKPNFNGVNIVPLFEFFCNTGTVDNRTYFFHEIYDRFFISTKYSVINNKVRIVKQTVEKQGINLKHEGIVTWKGLSLLNKYCTDYKLTSDDLKWMNFADIPELNVGDNNYTIDRFCTEIKQFIYNVTEDRHDTVFSYILFSYNRIAEYLDGSKIVDINNTQQRGINLQNESATYCVSTISQSEKFPLWMLVQQSTLSTLSIKLIRKKGYEGISSSLKLPDVSRFKNEIFCVGNSIKVIKFLIDAKPDVFNNLHVGIYTIGKQFIFNLINFSNEQFKY